ncbi:MAG: Ig-like domain-containing protein [Eubacterium sp.]
MKKLKKVAVLTLTASLALSITAQGNKTLITAKKSPAKVNKIKFVGTGKRLKLQKGKTYQLKTSVSVTPNKKKYKTVTFTSSNKKVVSVSKKGLVKGIKRGTATIRAVSKINPKKKTSIRVSVTQDVLVKKIVLDRTKLSVCETEEEDIILSIKQILPKNAKNKAVRWESDDEDVVDVDDDGELCIGDPGTATIYVTADDEGGAYATCSVTVTEDPSFSDDDDDDDDDDDSDDDDADDSNDSDEE